MDVDRLVEKALEIYKIKDSFAAIIFLCDLQDPEITMNALSSLMRHQYWHEKYLVGALAFGRAGIQFALQSASQYDQSQSEVAHKLRSGAKSLAYDVASFAWIGWDEPGVEITSADQSAGFDAARVNLRLAIELERGDLPINRAHWMISAYHMAEGECREAITAFEQGSAFAKNADAMEDKILNQGYILVSEMLISPEDTSAKNAYENLKESFQAVEHGEDFIHQLDTAYKVFSSQGAL